MHDNKKIEFIFRISCYRVRLYSIITSAQQNTHMYAQVSKLMFERASATDRLMHNRLHKMNYFHFVLTSIKVPHTKLRLNFGFKASIRSHSQMIWFTLERGERTDDTSNICARPKVSESPEN